MSKKLLIKLLAITIGLGVIANYNKEIIEIGSKQIQKAKEIVALYNKRNEELATLYEEITKGADDE